MTVTAGVVVHYAEIQRVLHLRQMELWQVRDQLATHTRLAVHLTPMPPVTPALDAIMAAIDAIERLKESFRNADPAMEQAG